MEAFVPVHYSTIDSNTVDFVVPCELNQNVVKYDIDILNIPCNIREDINRRVIFY